MTDPRPWIILLGCVTFLGGLGAGMLYSEFQAGPQESGPFADYARLLGEEFDLSAERRAHLEVILREYDEDIQQISLAHHSAYLDSLQDELRPVGLTFNGYIRDKVLHPKHRERFDELVHGVPFSPHPVQR